MVGWEILGVQAIGLALAMVALWAISLPLRNASIVDLFWGCAFVLVAWGTVGWLAWRTGEPPTARGILLVAMTTLWGLRLTIYLTWRNWGEPEDYRYRSMREVPGRNFARFSLVWIFLLQGLLVWVVSLPLQMGIPTRWPLAWLDGLGIVIWGVGWCFETIGDWQLARFRRDPANRGKVLDTGLWAYTRHPNYFGDCLVWWGIYLMAASGGAAWTILGPITMTILLMRVSGVSLLESTITERRPDYRAYQERTSPFFPWPPRRVTK